MSTSFKLTPIMLAMLPLVFASNAYAAEDTEKENDTDETETIEVTGYRGSLQKAISQKRNSSTIVDSIFAEDIGKSTDQNIADALSRVTGVTVQESDGEGTRISVRGAGASLNQISLNGVALTSGLNGGGSDASADQSVDLSAFSSDILASIDVIKTPSADHDEGSLGANVILRTAKPLNIMKNKRSLEIQGRYNDFADETDRKISGTFSHKFLDDTLGVIITASDETSSFRRDEVAGDWLTPYQVVDLRAGGATDLHTGDVITEDTKAIIRKGLTYNLNQNSRDRQSFTAGIQFLPGYTTDIQLDLSYSKAESKTDNHRINVGAPDFWSNKEKYNLADDPQADWWVVDQTNHTLVKSLNRFGSGSLGRSKGGDESENSVASLTIRQEVGDNFVIDLTAGYSKTDYESLPNSNVNTATWNTISPEVLRKADVDTLEPVGYDCTSGKCQMVVATEEYTYVPDGVNNNQNNIATGGFNPLDPYASHLGFVSKYDNNTTDINKSLFLDVDWDIEFLGVNQVEFGVKWSKRDKDVYTNYQQLQGPGTVVFDPETGQPIRGQAVSDVQMVDVLSGESFPVDNFMDDLVSTSNQYNSDFMKGWGLLDADKAFKEIFSIEDASLVDNDSGSRRIIQDNYSLYAKLNFSYLEDKLTGNVGVRLVNTDVTSYGSASINYFSNPQVFDANQLVHVNQLANESLDPCPELNGASQGVLLDPTIKCYDYSITHNFTNWNQTTNQILDVDYNDAGQVVSINQNEAADGNSWRAWWANYRHSDQTTQKQLGAERFGEERAQDIYQRAYSSVGESSSDILLPSLNLNYAISNEIIGRFAVSKTMARPKFDSLAPGFSANEDVWGQFSRVRANNPSLKPLESKNLDLSLEWYFNQTGQLSLAYFRKDMTDFEEEVKDRFYWNDFRDDYDREALTIDELLVPLDESMMAYNVEDQSYNCMPDRMVYDQLKDPLKFGCDLIEATIIRNGSGAQTQGLEFGYTQNYDFLPGLLSGLGLTFNYTYADSESDAETLEIAGQEGKKLKALPQAYTPKHSANATLFWEHNGLELRAAHRYNSIQLVNRGITDGVEWQDETNRLDLSANYRINPNVLVTFHALNVTDDTTRTFFTSSTMDLGNGLILDEGNAMDGDVDTSRTMREFKTGRQFRASVRVDF